MQVDQINIIESLKWYSSLVLGVMSTTLEEHLMPSSGWKRKHKFNTFKDPFQQKYYMRLSTRRNSYSIIAQNVMCLQHFSSYLHMGTVTFLNVYASMQHKQIIRMSSIRDNTETFKELIPLSHAHQQKPSLEISRKRDEILAQIHEQNKSQTEVCKAA